MARRVEIGVRSRRGEGKWGMEGAWVGVPGRGGRGEKVGGGGGVGVNGIGGVDATDGTGVEGRG